MSTTRQFARAPKGKRHVNVPYGSMLYDLDAGIGELLAAVDAAAIGDHTYIIYTADNGCIPSADPGNLNGPLHGHKASVWEGGIRVPFMVVGPGVKAGAVSHTPVVGYDILPTICDLAGIPSWPATVEGGSLKPVLLGDGTADVVRPGDFLVFHWPHYQHQKKSTPDTTLLADGWKLHYWWETGNLQLFHLDQDLGESMDVAAKFPERTAQMKKTLETYLTSIKAQLPEVNPNYDPASTKPGKNSNADSGAQ